MARHLWPRGRTRRLPSSIESMQVEAMSTSRLSSAIDAANRIKACQAVYFPGQEVVSQPQRRRRMVNITREEHVLERLMAKLAA